MSTLRAPSTTLLRTFLKPSTLSQCQHQSRHVSNYMPRSRYAKVTRLDKLHRTQKAAARAERFAALQRADSISATINSSPSTSAQVLPFSVSRTASSQLPVYELAKNGGNRHITTIRKLSGDLESLAAQLRAVLKLPEYIVDQKGNKKTTIAINQLTSQVVVRGWRGQEVKAWMEGVGF